MQNASGFLFPKTPRRRFRGFEEIKTELRHWSNGMVFAEEG